MLPFSQCNYEREEIIKNEVVNLIRYFSVNVVFSFAQRTSKFFVFFLGVLNIFR